MAGSGKPQKAVCPFGFGSEASGGPTVTALHCPKCRGLFYECVKTNCGHNFCRECMPQGRECLQCGDQVTDLQSDSKVQGLVDTFVATHSTDDKFLADKKATEAKDPETVKAEFLLETALQSFAGHNFPAAATRLRLCRDHLLHLLEARGGSTSLSVQFGAVCGSLGDCKLQMGDAEGAVKEYQASIRHLEECPSKSAEVERALSVTQNKSGDLCYRVGDLAAAKSLYSRALEVRRGVLAGATEAERPAAELDVALSLAKLADINQVLEDQQGALSCLEEAKGIAGRLQTQKQGLDASGGKRLQALAAFLAA
jgi:tetratricopeptide (TPR) repeat protein